jgi:hypothetical protein
MEMAVILAMLHRHITAISISPLRAGSAAKEASRRGGCAQVLAGPA